METIDKRTNKLDIKSPSLLVDDALEWINPKDKRSGYEPIDGNLLKSVNFDVGKGVPLSC